MRVASGHRQRGLAAIEFALVFPLLFLMLYGTFVYGYVFFLQQTIVFAAQESAQAAAKVPPELAGGGAAYEERMEDAIRAAATDSLAFLPSAAREAVLGSDGDGVLVNISPAAIGGTVQVTLELKPSDLLPVITFPVLGAIPPLPQTLRAVGTVGV